VQTEYTYEPFGRTSSSGASDGNTFQYTGRENDGTGLYHYRARSYSPALHRFVSEDPLGFAAGDPNLYAYVFNSPTTYTDPLGLSFAAHAGAGPAPDLPPDTAGRKDEPEYESEPISDWELALMLEDDCQSAWWKPWERCDFDVEEVVEDVTEFIGEERNTKLYCAGAFATLPTLGWRVGGAQGAGYGVAGAAAACAWLGMTAFLTDDPEF
jgi:RHS repeat-associated protein